MRTEMFTVPAFLGFSAWALSSGYPHIAIGALVVAGMVAGIDMITGAR